MRRLSDQAQETADALDRIESNVRQSAGAVLLLQSSCWATDPEEFVMKRDALVALAHSAQKMANCLTEMMALLKLEDIHGPATVKTGKEN